MKAVGYRNSLPITDARSLIDVEIADPVPGARDLLVEVRAISVNPVDTKVRMRAAPEPGGIIDDPKTFDVMLFKRKSVSLHWEFMFTRAVFETQDMLEQHRLLTNLAEMVDAGSIHTTLSEDFGPINAANLRRAHALIESGRSTGQIVLSGF